MLSLNAARLAFVVGSLLTDLKKSSMSENSASEKSVGSAALVGDLLESVKSGGNSGFIDPSRHSLFLRCFTIHEATLSAYVRRLMPSRADADDVIQEVALVLWAKFEQFREGSDFRNWAFGVARFEVLAWLRDNRRDRLVLAGDVAEMIADESCSDVLRLENERLALQSCLQKLSPKNRDLILESYGSESNIRNVALTSGRSVTGFYQWLYRMRHSLLKCIQREVSRAVCP
jgi:RNA polymerase sigma-70 factor (ECF subfamily)